MPIDNPEENSDMNVDRSIAELQLAFSGSETKGTLFWAVLLLPDTEINEKINVKMVNKLPQRFVGPQKNLAVNTVKNLQYLRSKCLVDNDAKVKIEQAKSEAIKQAATTSAINRVIHRLAENTERER